MQAATLMEKSLLATGSPECSNQLILTAGLITGLITQQSAHPHIAFDNMIKLHEEKLEFFTLVTHTKIVLLFSCSTAACFYITVIFEMLLFVSTAEML